MSASAKPEKTDRFAPDLLRLAEAIERLSRGRSGAGPSISRRSKRGRPASLLSQTSRLMR